MKTLLLSSVAMFGLTGTAIAGNLVVPSIIELVPAPPAAHDWSGLYVGGQAVFASGGTITTGTANPYPINAATVINGSVATSFNSTTGYGGFVGYNIQKGAMVFGAELAVTMPRLAEFGSPANVQKFYADAKLRLGYSFGKAMVYGVAGYSFGAFDNGGVPYAQTGYVYGAGVDFMVTDSLFMGLEYTQRKISGPDLDPGTSSIESNIQSVALRIGWNF